MLLNGAASLLCPAGVCSGPCRAMQVSTLPPTSSTASQCADLSAPWVRLWHLLCLQHVLQAEQGTPSRAHARLLLVPPHVVAPLALPCCSTPRSALL
jgi:hypothetical protein